MLGITQSAALVGVDAHPVQVEVNTGEAGELKFILVGLPDAAVKESQDRVFSAMANSGFRTPATRTTINLAPGGLRKEGPAYDLPIALAILASMKKCEDTELDHYWFCSQNLCAIILRMPHLRCASSNPVVLFSYLLQPLRRLCLYVAEREGFEPPEPFGSMVFKTTAFDHSAISPVN